MKSKDFYPARYSKIVSAREYMYISSYGESFSGRISFRVPYSGTEADLNILVDSSRPFYLGLLNRGAVESRLKVSATTFVLTYLSISLRVYSISPLCVSLSLYTFSEGFALTSISQQFQFSSIKISRPSTWKQRGLSWSVDTKQWYAFLR